MKRDVKKVIPFNTNQRGDGVGVREPTFSSLGNTNQRGEVVGDRRCGRKKKEDEASGDDMLGKATEIDGEVKSHHRVTTTGLGRRVCDEVGVDGESGATMGEKGLTTTRVAARSAISNS